MGNMRRRWDTDERGTGIGSGEPFLPNIAKLGDAMRDPSWVTEDPELHLLPHLEKACSEPGSPLRLVSARSAGLVFVVELEWTGSEPGQAPCARPPSRFWDVSLRKPRTSISDGAKGSRISRW